jgi:hypothetical protein
MSELREQADRSAGAQRRGRVCAADHALRRLIIDGKRLAMAVFP